MYAPRKISSKNASKPQNSDLLQNNTLILQKLSQSEVMNMAVNQTVQVKAKGEGNKVLKNEPRGKLFNFAKNTEEGGGGSSAGQISINN